MRNRDVILCVVCVIMTSSLHMMLLFFSDRKKKYRLAIRPQEIVALVLVFTLWVFSIALFIHKWGMIRTLEPREHRRRDKTRDNVSSVNIRMDAGAAGDDRISNRSARSNLQSSSRPASPFLTSVSRPSSPYLIPRSKSHSETRNRSPSLQKAHLCSPVSPAYMRARASSPNLRKFNMNNSNANLQGLSRPGSPFMARRASSARPSYTPSLFHLAQEAMDTNISRSQMLSLAPTRSKRIPSITLPPDDLPVIHTTPWTVEPLPLSFADAPPVREGVARPLPSRQRMIPQLSRSSCDSDDTVIFTTIP